MSQDVGTYVELYSVLVIIKFVYQLSSFSEYELYLFELSFYKILLLILIKGKCAFFVLL